GGAALRLGHGDVTDADGRRLARGRPAQGDAVEDVVGRLRGVGSAWRGVETDADTLPRGDGSVVGGVLNYIVIAAVADDGGVPDVCDCAGEVELERPAVDGGGARVGQGDGAGVAAAPVVG